MREWQVLCHGCDCAVCPLQHEIAQVEVVVDGIIVELFLLNLILLVFESDVQPLQNVQHLDGSGEQLVVHLEALNNVHS